MAGGGSGDASGSLFHVGDNVELWRLATALSVLVLFVVAFEHALHALGHALQKYPKYHGMLTKVYGELMILGFIGLAIKILKELAHLDAYSKRMIAFQAADLTVFILAIALILQAISVFLQLRAKNIQVDKAELISSAHLVDLVARRPPQTWWRRLSTLACCAGVRRGDKRAITDADLPEVATMRILRHYLLRSFGLPELFPFSKYLRQAQDNQITHLIEVETSTWILLIAAAWAIEAVAHVVLDAVKMDEHDAIVVAFLAFSWFFVLLHLVIHVYFGWAIGQLLSAASTGGSGRGNAARGVNARYARLNEIADDEALTADSEMAGDAIAVMERVREDERRKKVQRRRNALTKHDTGLQLVATIMRKVSSKLLRDPTSGRGDAADAAVDEAALHSKASGRGARRPRIHLRGFSRKAWHVVVMSSLMLNGFFLALFCQCVLYQMGRIYRTFGVVAMSVIPLPLLVNMLYFQPRILRNFILVSSIVRVDDTALGDVIDHFTETIQLRSEFVHCVNDFLARANQTPADLLAEFEARDETRTGLLEVDEVRLVLHRFGFKLSFFRFNSVAKLLFNLRGIQIEYAQVLQLLALGQQEEMRALYGDSLVLVTSDGLELYHHHDSEHLSASFTMVTHADPSPYLRHPASAGANAYTAGVTSAGAGATAGAANTNANANASARGRHALLRAKSSVASSLYNFDFDAASNRAGDPTAPAPPPPPLPSNTPTTRDTHYLRM